MAINVTKPSVNLREKLNELETNKGLKGNEILQAETAQEVRSLISAGRKNLIINGDMQVSQRGTSFSTNGYNLDRWYMATNGTLSVSQAWSSELGMYYFNATNTIAWGAYQKVEDKNCRHLKVGDVITISLYTNASMWLGFGVSGVSTSNYEMTTIETIGSWTRQSMSFTMDSTLVNGILAGNPLYVEPKPKNTGSFGFTGVQLELGSVATDFEHRSYGEELALCQRYYEEMYLPNAVPVTVGQGYNTRKRIGPFNFLVQKRVTPSIPAAYVDIDGGDSSHYFTFPASTTVAVGKSTDNVANIGGYDIAGQYGLTLKIDAEL